MADPTREAAILAAALAKLPDAERTVFLESACVGDSDLSHRLQERLAALAAGGLHVANAAHPAAPTIDAPTHENVGARVGP